MTTKRIPKCLLDYAKAKKIIKEQSNLVKNLEDKCIKEIKKIGDPNEDDLNPLHEDVGQLLKIPSVGTFSLVYSNEYKFSPTGKVTKLSKEISILQERMDKKMMQLNNAKQSEVSSGKVKIIKEESHLRFQPKK